MSHELTIQELVLVARHGSSRLTRCLGVVQLAHREDRLDELCEQMALEKS